MTTLTAAMLEVARLMRDVFDGTATGGSTTTLEDTSLTMPADYYTGGTLWILSGDNEGECIEIVEYGESTFTFAALSNAIAAGVQYAAAPGMYKKHELKQSVLAALRNARIEIIDETLTVVESQEEYALPTGVRDVLSVEIAENAETPFTWSKNQYWVETSGSVCFNPDKIPDQSEGNKIRLHYAGGHPDIDDTDSLQVDVNDIKWSAAVILWRRLMQTTYKDNPVAVEMFNEAKMMEAEALRQMKRVPQPDAKLAAW